MLRFRVSESLSKKAFLRIGQGCADLLEQSLANTKVSLDQAQRVLDFGCGCGRTIRWLIPRYPSVRFYGVDVDRQAIQWCQTELSRGQFLSNGANPPLPYPDNHFDVIYSVSVFTHLSEPMQDAWLAELKRLLKPSGVLVLTIYAADTTSAALDAGAIDELRAKGFLHRRSTKLKGIVPDWYHTTWHSREYIVSRLANSFSDVRCDSVPGGLQDFIVAKRPPRSVTEP